jgi:hypothetical protein
MAPEGVKVRIQAFLTSTLDRSEKSLSLPDRFTRAKSSSGIYWGLETAERAATRVTLYDTIAMQFTKPTDCR